VVGCSTDRYGDRNNRLPANDQKIASTAELDLKGTTLKVFPPVLEGNYFRFHFFFETRDVHNQLTDFKVDDLRIFTDRKKLIKFEVQKVSLGKYYLNFRHTINNSELGLSFFLKNQLIHKIPNFSLSLVDNSKSWIKAYGLIQDGVRLRLFLSNDKGNLIKPLVPPEIIVSGEAEITDFKETDQGLWEFNLLYPNYNQIIYLSVRTQGSFIGQIYRFQHIEK